MPHRTAVLEVRRSSNPQASGLHEDLEASSTGRGSVIVGLTEHMGDEELLAHAIQLEAVLQTHGASVTYHPRLLKACALTFIITDLAHIQHVHLLKARWQVAQPVQTEAEGRTTMQSILQLHDIVLIHAQGEHLKTFGKPAQTKHTLRLEELVVRHVESLRMQSQTEALSLADSFPMTWPLQKHGGHGCSR